VLREKLDRLKVIERESRQMIALRQNPVGGAARCTQLLRRLKPQARKIGFEAEDIQNPAAWDIVMAARSVSVCMSCDEADDGSWCLGVREAIRDAERALNKATRRK
jgi:hypothetical protein